MHALQLWKKAYAYQYIYLPIVYGLLSVKFRYQDVTDLWIA